MKYQIALNNTYVKDKLFPMNTIILYLDNGMILVASNFNNSRKKDLPVTLYIPSEKKWVTGYVKNEYTETMWGLHRKQQRKHRSNTKQNYEQMMKHDRIHKNGGGGSHIGRNTMVTDYECTKEPMHDFRRSMYVQWN